MQSAHTATCAPIYKYRRSPPCHGRAHTHTPARTHARTRRHACTQTHARTREHHRTARANTRRGVTRSRARAQIRTARMCSRAHGRYRRGGSARTSAAEPAARLRLPIACVHARTDASSISYAIRRCGGAQVSATAAMAPLPIAPRHISADLRANARAHIHVYPPMDQYIYAHTHGVCSRLCASRGDAIEGMQGGWAAGTLEHLPGRRAMRSSRERRRLAVGLHLSVRPSRVGTRRWCRGGSCHLGDSKGVLRGYSAKPTHSHSHSKRTRVRARAHTRTHA
jgi:hypothetical protein